jgi:hypothetical protein
MRALFQASTFIRTRSGLEHPECRRDPQASPHFSGMLSNKRIKKAENLSEKNRNAPIDGEDRHERPERVEY